MKRLQYEKDGVEKTILAEKIGKTLWLHVDGETFSFEPEAVMGGGAGNAAGSDPSRILAPMPGKIIKVLSQSGEKVAAGDTVVVMEAMKMEYALKAAEDSKVKTVQFKEGDQVTLGDILVELEVTDG